VQRLSAGLLRFARNDAVHPAMTTDRLLNYRPTSSNNNFASASG
jgi:hypothetical protein